MNNCVNVMKFFTVDICVIPVLRERAGRGDRTSKPQEEMSKEEVGEDMNVRNEEEDKTEWDRGTEARSNEETESVFTLLIEIPNTTND